MKETKYITCPVCEGESSWYGMAPHRHDLNKTGSMIGSTVLEDKAKWPDNFFEDPEAPGCGVWSCERCDGNGVVNKDGSIIEG